MFSLFSLLQNVEYRKYSAATVLTSVGDGMYFIAISWFLYQLTGTALSIGWILIVTTLPGLLFSPWIGPLVDRWKSRSICVVTDLARGAILAYLAYAMYSRELAVIGIYVATFVLSLLDNFFRPASSALVRDIAMKDKLLKANVISNMSMQIGTLAGASLGGILVNRFGATVVILINAVSFIISAILTFWISTPARSTVPTSAARSTILREFMDTLNYIRGHETLTWLAVQQMFVYILLYICNTLLPVFVDRELGSDAFGFGIIDAAWGIGALAGGAALHRIIDKIGSRQLGTIGLTLVCGALVLFLTARHVPQAVFAYFALGFLGCIIRVSTDTVIAAEIDPDIFGKVKASISMFISYISLAVFALVGYVGDKVSVRWIYLALCALILATVAGFGLRQRIQRPKALTPELK